jgi:pimeloyl-ACP methyl ester carboxylesterase
MLALYKEFIELKYQVIMPSLPFHETDFINLNKLKLNDIEHFIEGVLSDRRLQYPFTIVGSSFGALLALIIAARVSSLVARVILISPVIKLRSSLQDCAINLFSYLPHSFLKRLGEIRKKKRGENIFLFHRESSQSYPIATLSLLAQVRRLALKEIKKIKGDVIVLADYYDHLLDPITIQAFCQRSAFDLNWFPGGEHELLIGKHHNHVVKLITGCSVKS